MTAPCPLTQARLEEYTAFQHSAELRRHLEQLERTAVNRDRNREVKDVEVGHILLLPPLLRRPLLLLLRWAVAFAADDAVGLAVVASTASFRRVLLLALTTLVPLVRLVRQAYKVKTQRGQEAKHEPKSEYLTLGPRAGEELSLIALENLQVDQDDFLVLLRVLLRAVACWVVWLPASPRYPSVC